MPQDKQSLVVELSFLLDGNDDDDGDDDGDKYGVYVYDFVLRVMM
jgi:hypothetical protein